MPDNLKLETFRESLHLACDCRDSIRDYLLSDKGTEADQWQRHGFAWISTTVQALDCLCRWAEALQEENRLGRMEQLILGIGFTEYLMQLAHGVPMGQEEVIRSLHYPIVSKNSLEQNAATAQLLKDYSGHRPRYELVRLLLANGLGSGLGDDGLSEELAPIRREFRRFADHEIRPQAQHWHQTNALIPDSVIEQMAEMGAFGITVPEQYGGLSLGRVAMCVVTEELSRGYIGTGSLGTRTEIACELIKSAGTESQKQRYLPPLVRGQIIPTAVFTEPDHGSDLANLKTRAEHTGDGYRITGNKTWITHAARADLMTLLARTGEPGYRGLSLFLAEKSRGSETEPFPDPGLDGSEIAVLGYRGMREYELSFDGFTIDQDQLLGGEAGRGFKQLMATFESARIQTAARAIGVAQNALELALEYAQQRHQFDKPIIEYPRIHGKLAWMVVELMITRQMTYHAGLARDSGKRCDVEAGMAKLLAARAAWSAADNAVQIHGGNGYATEFPVSRLLCDARILNLFEGSSEIQAEVIANRLLT